MLPECLNLGDSCLPEIVLCIVSLSSANFHAAEQVSRAVLPTFDKLLLHSWLTSKATERFRNSKINSSSYSSRLACESATNKRRRKHIRYIWKVFVSNCRKRRQKPVDSGRLQSGRESFLGMRKIEKITSSSYKQEVESSQKNKRLGATNLFFFLLRAS